MDDMARTQVHVISNPCPARDRSTHHLLHLPTPTPKHPGKTRSTASNYGVFLRKSASMGRLESSGQALLSKRPDTQTRQLSQRRKASRCGNDSTPGHKLNKDMLLPLRRRRARLLIRVVLAFIVVVVTTHIHCLHYQENHLQSAEFN